MRDDSTCSSSNSSNRCSEQPSVLIKDSIFIGNFDKIVVMELHFQSSIPIGKWIVWKEEIVMHKIGEDLYEVYPEVRLMTKEDLKEAYTMLFVTPRDATIEGCKKSDEPIPVSDPWGFEGDRMCTFSRWPSSMYVPYESLELHSACPPETAYNPKQRLKPKSHYKAPVLKQRKCNRRPAFKA